MGKGALVALGLRSVLKDVNIECSIVFKSDASAAIGIGNRIGSGKVRHIEVTQLWLQDKVTQKVFILEKVSTDDNLADAVAKGVDATAIQAHLEGGSAAQACGQRAHPTAWGAHPNSMRAALATTWGTPHAGARHQLCFVKARDQLCFVMARDQLCFV